MNTVAVLMSTYNGEKYIREQIESILNQEDVDVHLFIRDDGSKDNTLAIVEQYQENYRNITLFRGENVGVGNSFMNLLYLVDKGFDYYAFADQDDVWLPGKLARAIEKIQDERQPILYASNQILVDQDLNKLGYRYSEDPDTSYKQILCQNKISGCTMVWNRALNNYLTEEKRRPSESLLRNRIHDVWVAMVAAVIGKVVYDKTSYILYRQHEHNVVGVRKTNSIKQWKDKLHNQNKRNGRSRICQEVLQSYSDKIENQEIKGKLYLYAFYRTKRLKSMLIRDMSIISHTNEKPGEYVLKVLLGLF